MRDPQPGGRRRSFLLRVALGLCAGGAAALLAGLGPAGAESVQPPSSVAPEVAAASSATQADELVTPPPSAPPPQPFPVAGVLTFRGSTGRNWYGTGPIPATPTVRWRFPQQGQLCGDSTVGQQTKEWCGTGWTGQPAVFERDGRTWLVVGAYDHQVHFLDAATGEPLLPPFPTGDIIKGSVTVDPDGYPLVDTGSRDDRLRVLAIDGDEPRELWALDAADATGPTLWNNDWDGSPVVHDDLLLEGGENSRFHVVRLHRGYGADGRVTVAPELLADVPGWDEQLLADIGDRNVSIEGSVTLVGKVAYFANSGGLVQGWDLTDPAAPQRVFRFWTGDDTDATLVADETGALYAASEWERHTARSREVGQVMRLDPATPDDPLVWSWTDPDTATEDIAGVWSTPALDRDVLYVGTNGGRLVALDRTDGTERWSLQLDGKIWGSPVVVDGVLLIGDCGGTMHAFDVADTTAAPPERWSLPIGGCIESTPAVWDGGIYLGTRAGALVGIGEAGPALAPG